MTRSFDLTRRFLLGASAAGVSLAFAGHAGAQSASESPNKLVVVIARGAMDGLSVIVPTQEPNYHPLRGALAIENSLTLSDGFGLHPALTELHALHGRGQMRFAPAVAIPARVRSHFDAQDVLENGGEGLRRQTDGWLNRALAETGGMKGLAIGSQTPLILRGSAATSSWAPGGRTGSEDRIASLLQDLYVEDRLLAENLAAGLETEAQAMAMGGDMRVGRDNVAGLGQAVARLMTGPEGADVVALSVDGWDTHARQVGQLQVRLSGLDQLVAGLRTGLAGEWDRTVVVIATEFGRTARANGHRWYRSWHGIRPHDGRRCAEARGHDRRLADPGGQPLVRSPRSGAHARRKVRVQERAARSPGDRTRRPGRAGLPGQCG